MWRPSAAAHSDIVAIPSNRPSVLQRPFGTLPDGTAVDLYSVTNGSIQLQAINFGAIITSLRVPDRRGTPGDVVIGYGRFSPYVHNPSYFGAVVGRYANRIACGRFDLDGTMYQLATNDGTHHLHGGSRGFDQCMWAASLVSDADTASVTFTRTSPSGEEHYPGTLQVAVTYLLTANDTVEIRYEATTDAATVVNLTQHTYFNLGGETCPNVLGHELQIHAKEYLPVDTTLIPTGEMAAVDGTPFDFRAPVPLGTRIQLDYDQLRRGRGYDHTFVLTRRQPDLEAAAELHDPQSGRRLVIATTEPGLQFYAGQLLDGRVTDAHGRRLHRHAGVCLETQHFPDSPNQPQFPPVTLRPHECFASMTTWRFMAT